MLFLTQTWTSYFKGSMLTKCLIYSNECSKNIFHNFILNRIIKYNYKHPPWITDDVKTKLKEQSKLTKKYYKNGNIAKSNECTKAISAAKDKDIKQMGKKLYDPLTAPKTYWKILNRLLSNKNVPAISSLLVDGEIISNFSQKVAIFNKYFASQCTLLQNSSSLPMLRLRTDKTISSLNINEDDIFAIIENPMDEMICQSK